ncbi:MAG: hypothetical protein ABFS39_19755 [Pseudomonadota bacterium]
MTKNLSNPYCNPDPENDSEETMRVAQNSFPVVATTARQCGNRAMSALPPDESTGRLSSIAELSAGFSTNSGVGERDTPVDVNNFGGMSDKRNEE